MMETASLKTESAAPGRAERDGICATVAVMELEEGRSVTAAVCVRWAKPGALEPVVA